MSYGIKWQIWKDQTKYNFRIERHQYNTSILFVLHVTFIVHKLVKSHKPLDNVHLECYHGYKITLMYNTIVLNIFFAFLLILSKRWSGILGFPKWCFNIFRSRSLYKAFLLFICLRFTKCING